MFCGIKSNNKCLKCCFSALIQVHNRFAPHSLPIDNTLFEVSPNRRGMSCRVAVVMETMQLVLS